ncbi:hypothetical protein, partial [Enterobacter cloacae]|uniref:hypothetical protein n=1 Tax=Enterobacter cloacae TaxID=550 RepID=UPI003BF9945B|nr:hypothetical protein [Enterobacter cloacae]
MMNYFVLATHAVTVDGEWVTPESVQQVDFDSLLCICQQRVKSDPLTATTNGLILIHLVYSGLASA